MRLCCWRHKYCQLIVNQSSICSHYLMATIYNNSWIQRSAVSLIFESKSENFNSLQTHITKTGKITLKQLWQESNLKGCQKQIVSNLILWEVFLDSLVWAVENIWTEPTCERELFRNILSSTLAWSWLENRKRKIHAMQAEIEQFILEFIAEMFRLVFKPRSSFTVVQLILV